MKKKKLDKKIEKLLFSNCQCLVCRYYSKDNHELTCDTKGGVCIFSIKKRTLHKLAKLLKKGGYHDGV